jgi:hypothetical protein
LFALSPQGALLWNKPGFNTRGGYGGIDIVFSSSGQYYFTTNASGAVLPAGGLFAYHGKTQRWNKAGIGQPRLHIEDGLVVGDGNPVHPGLIAYDSAGNERWRALTEGTSPIQAQTSLEAAPDGAVYVGTLTYATGRHLTALNPDGSLRWQYFGNGIMSVPVLNPANTLVVIGGYNPGAPGWVDAVRTNGDLAWRLDLPADNGAHVWAMATPRFSADGRTVYVGMTGNNYAPDIYSYFYAIDSGEAVEPVNADEPPTADEPSVAVAALGGFATILGGSDATGTLTLAAAAPAGGLTVSLTSTNSAVSIPATIKVPEGATKAKFPIVTSIVAGKQTGQIVATSGASSVSRNVTVRPIGVKSIVLTPSKVRGGSESVATITLEAPAAPGDITVKVSSSKAAAAPASATLVIRAGALTATTVVKTSAVSADLVITIKATANGLSKNAKLTLTP